MFRDNFRDSKITDPNMYFAYTPLNTSPPKLQYVLISDIELLKNGPIPDGPNDDLHPDLKEKTYYSNNTGKYAGTTMAARLMYSPEIMAYLQKDEDFIKRCIAEGKIDFFPEDIKELFFF
jgi:hypothetical protein